MSLSTFDIFSVGIGPSSSHTVGPMLAAHDFLKKIKQQNILNDVQYIKCDFYGSLGLTGKGHGSDKAFILGIQNFLPESIDSNLIPKLLERCEKEKTLL